MRDYPEVKTRTVDMDCFECEGEMFKATQVSVGRFSVMLILREDGDLVMSVGTRLKQDPPDSKETGLGMPTLYSVFVCPNCDDEHVAVSDLRDATSIETSLRMMGIDDDNTIKLMRSAMLAVAEVVTSCGDERQQITDTIIGPPIKE